MLFNPDPKEDRNELFDRENELKMIESSLSPKDKTRLIIVYGIRRIGKTSLVNVALKESKLPNVYIDIRGVFSKSGVVSEHLLVKELLESFMTNIPYLERLGYKVREFWYRLTGITVQSFGIQKTMERRFLIQVLKEINKWSIENDTVFVIALDEAQYLRFSKLNFNVSLAYSIDNLKNIKFLITGSEVGILREFLGLEDYNSPIYGRPRQEVYLDRFKEEQSVDFLRKGFEELKVNYNEEELREVEMKVDGVVGWLTLYGFYRGVKKLSHKEALNTVFEEGSKTVISEMERIIQPSKDRYLAILEAVSSGLNNWERIKAYVEAKTNKRITNSKLDKLIKNLVKYGYLNKIERGVYKISDPVEMHAILKLRETHLP